MTSETCKHLDDKEKISEPVDDLTDGFAINGCCGGGCYVITGINFCPFCGINLTEAKK